MGDYLTAGHTARGGRTNQREFSFRSFRTPHPLYNRTRHITHICDYSFGLNLDAPRGSPKRDLL